MFEEKRYPDVDVYINKDDKSGIIKYKSFFIKKNKQEVLDKLSVMCLKHDLKMTKKNALWGEDAVVCQLKIFDSINDIVAYLAQKANKQAYRFRIKSEYALVNIGDKKYIYQIKKIENNEE